MTSDLTFVHKKTDKSPIFHHLHDDTKHTRLNFVESDVFEKIVQFLSSLSNTIINFC